MTEGYRLVTNSSEKLKLSTKVAFGAGDLGPAITANILVFFLMYFFTQVAGLPPGLAGSILMIGKISDAINDPIVGVLTDRTKTRFGRRLPWILAGAIPFGLLFFCQWLVPHFSDNLQVNTWCLFAYYVFIGILFNIAYTMVNLPYTALTPELTQDYNERTSLNSFRFTFSIGGSILSLILAGIIFQTFPEQPITQYIYLALICTLLSVLPLFWCVARIQEREGEPLLNDQQKRGFSAALTPFGVVLVIYGVLQIFGGGNGAMLRGFCGLLFGILITAAGITLFDGKPEAHLDHSQAQNQKKLTETENIPFVEQLKIVFRNKPFLFVIGIYLSSWLAVQLTASILPYFVVSWMGLPASTFPNVALMVQGTALVMLYVNSYLSKRFGKKIVYFMGTILWIIAQGGLFFLQPGQIPLMYFLAFIAGFGVSTAYLIPWSMIPDVIEFDELETGKRREGIFYGFMVLLQKVGLALGLFLVGQALEISGFLESVPGQPLPTQPASALLAIRLAIGPIPTITLIIGLFLAYFYPITQSLHQEIRLKLQQRKLDIDHQ